MYYGDFNLITPFHFQYSTPDPIIFGYNNLSMIFFMCVKSTLFFIWFHIRPTSFFKHIVEFILIGIPFAILPNPCPLEHSNSCFTFDCISLFVAFSLFHYYPCVPENMATFHDVGRSELTIMVDDLGTTSISWNNKKHVFTNKLCFNYSTKFYIKLIIHATSKQDVNKQIY